MIFRTAVKFLSFFLIVVFSFASAVRAETLSDEALLEKIQHSAFKYFIEEANPQNGLVRDRAHNFRKGATQSASSIAATGFGLSAYPVGVSRGWISREDALGRTRRALEFFLNTAAEEHGFFYHFLTMEGGKRAIHSELSPIDTALLLAGILFSAEYYKDPVITALAAKIYERVDWPWMLNGGKTLAMSWSPETGFSRHRWDHYNESMLMYLMAIASPSHPLPASSWKQIRKTVASYKGFRVIQMPPLFTHQYSHVWVDFRDKNDGFADYFLNSVNATLANRAFAIDQAKRYKTYGPDSWGLTASDGPNGYKAYGAPPGFAEHDGTIAPTACGGSIVFAPKECIACLRNFYEKHSARLWGRYGFSDAFNLDRNWFAPDVIGIDQGALLLMIENYRTELIWKVMSQSPVLKKAMRAVGFKKGTVPIPWPDPPKARAPYRRGGFEIDGLLKDWPNAPAIVLRRPSAPRKDTQSDKDLRAEVRFAWDEEALYFALRVNDESVISKRPGRHLWQDDALELFLDPQGDGLYWGNAQDFQLGFRAPLQDQRVETWAWFPVKGGVSLQGEDPSKDGRVLASGFAYEGGYLIEGAIRWSYLEFSPEAGKTLKLSPAVHDLDLDRSNEKIEWFFRNEEELGRYVLGTVTLGKKD